MFATVSSFEVCQSACTGSYENLAVSEAFGCGDALSCRNLPRSRERRRKKARTESKVDALFERRHFQVKGTSDKTHLCMQIRNRCIRRSIVTIC